MHVPENCQFHSGRRHQASTMWRPDLFCLPTDHVRQGCRHKVLFLCRFYILSISQHARTRPCSFVLIGEVPLNSVQLWLNIFCSSQPSLVHWLSSPIFPCSVVRCPAMVTSDQISTFFNTYRHKSPILTQYFLIPSSTNLYWPSTTKYQPVPVPSYIIFKCQTFLYRPEMSTVVR